MLKRILTLFLVMFLLCSCGKNTKEEITFSSWGSVTEVNILKQVIKNFEKENPDIKINFQHVPQNYFQKIHLLFASNTAPDVIFINNLYLPVYADKLEDLSKLTDTKKFYDKSIQSLTIDGKLLAIPRDISNLVVYYNKNFIAQEPKNFKEFENSIKSFSNSTPYGISYERDIFYAEPYILTLGDKNGIEFYKNLEGRYAPSPANTGSSTQAQMFLDKKLAYYISGRWMYPKLSESASFPFGVMTFKGNIYADASGWAISKNSKHKASAEKFVQYLASKDNIEYFTSTGLIVPARIDASKQLNNKKESPFLDAIKLSVIRTPDKNYRKHRDEANKKIFN